MSGISFNVCTPGPVSGCISFTPTATYGSVCANAGIFSVCNTSTMPSYTSSMVSQAVNNFSYMSNHCR